MTKQERDELREKLEGWEDLPIQTGFGNTVCTASQLRELLDGAERLERLKLALKRNLERTGDELVRKVWKRFVRTILELLEEPLSQGEPEG